MRTLRAATTACMLMLWAIPAQGQESTFLSQARAAAEAAPRDAAAQAALGEALIEAGQFDEARSVFTKASRLPDGRVLGTFGLAKVEMARERIKQARTNCRRLINTQKGSPVGHVCEGYAFLAWKRASRASGEFEKALEIDPSNADALVGMGEVNRSRLNVDEAEAAYRKALSASPGNARAYLGLGRLYMSVDRMSDAQKALRQAVQHGPGLSEARHYLGIVLGDTADGIAQHRKAVEIRPGWGRGLEALGQALHRTGANQEAVEVLTKATEAEPNLAGAFQFLGLSQAALNQYPQAEASLRQAIKLVPSLSQAVLALGDVQVKQGHYDQAIETYEQARDLSPRDAMIPLHTGKVYRMMARNTQARAQFNRSSQLDPDLAAPEVQLGDIYFDLEDWEEARVHYQAAKARPNQEGVDRAHLEQRLQALQGR